MGNMDISNKTQFNEYPEYLPSREVGERDLRIAEKFGIPEAAYDLLDFFFTEEDQSFIDWAPEVIIPDDENRDYISRAFSKGIISKADESGKEYRLSDFYGMLDVFSVTETKKYHTLSPDKRKALDDWYFDSYVTSLDRDMEVRPTADKVLTLNEMTDFIDSLEGPLYWSFCDCKSLGGECGLPSHTCINYAPGINSFAARGASQVISKEEAKQIIEESDKAGLVHTVSDHGICNCCDDCCYLFRSQQVRGSVGFWPESPHIVEYDKAKCISCGKCVARCHFKVFSKEGRSIDVDRKNCIGCGLCVNTCPVSALAMTDRKPTQMQIAGKRNDQEF